MQTKSTAEFRPIDRVKACILHACSLDANHEAKLDHIKLNKVLWYSDAAAYMARGRAISDGKYIRKPHGPVAKLMAPAMADLLEDNLIQDGRAFDSGRGAWVQTYEYIGALPGDEHLDSDLPELSDEEKGFIAQAFKGVCDDHDTASISERTHGNIWELAKNGEDIPMYAMFAERLGRITRSHIDAVFA